LIAQRTVIDEQEVPLFPGVLAIFGHGNVTSLGIALEGHRDEIPVWRGQNEQGMGLAAAGFAKAMRRRQIMVCSSSIGPGATNFITPRRCSHQCRKCWERSWTLRTADQLSSVYLRTSRRNPTIILPSSSLPTCTGSPAHGLILARSSWQPRPSAKLRGR